MCSLITRDNSYNADTCINRVRERERDRTGFDLFCAAIRYEKPTRHPSKASAKKYLKVGKQATRGTHAAAGYQNEGASTVAERE